jgi:hypothetical protein
VLFALLRVCDEPLREQLLDTLVGLVVVVRQHMRRFLPELLAALGELWSRSTRMQHTCLQACCSCCCYCCCYCCCGVCLYLTVW